MDTAASKANATMGVRITDVVMLGEDGDVEALIECANDPTMRAVKDGTIVWVVALHDPDPSETDREKALVGYGMATDVQDARRMLRMCGASRTTLEGRYARRRALKAGMADGFSPEMVKAHGITEN